MEEVTAPDPAHIADTSEALPVPYVPLVSELTMAEGILRKLLDVENQDDWGTGYIDLTGGVFDVRVRLTEDEIAYLRTLIDGSPDGDEG